MSESQRASFPLWGSLVLVLGVFVMATSIKQQKKEEEPAEIRSPLATTMIPPASAPKEKRKDTEEELVIEIPDWSATLPGDEGLSDEKRDAIQHEARAFMDRTKKDDPRRAEFLSRLTTNPNVICGRAHSAAISGALTTENIDPEVIADVVDRASTKCNEAIIESAGFAINVDDKLATALEARTTRSDSSPESKRAAWLAYGSIAETARRHHHRHARMAPSPREDEWISAVDSLLKQKLEAAKTPEDKLLFVRAAGNAGCESCRKQLDLHAQSSLSDLRRAAVAAHRFIDDEASQKLMCEALTKDRDDGVRDLAAWSLEWRTSYPETRVQCLTRAAEADPSARVRMQTVLALGILANDHVPLAEEALERLASSASDDRVAHLAASTLSTRNGSRTKTTADVE